MPAVVGVKRKPHRPWGHELLVDAMEALKRELQQVLRSTEYPYMLLGTISGVAAWAITMVLKLLFGS